MSSPSTESSPFASPPSDPSRASPTQQLRSGISKLNRPKTSSKQRNGLQLYEVGPVETGAPRVRRTENDEGGSSSRDASSRASLEDAGHSSRAVGIFFAKVAARMSGRVARAGGVLKTIVFLGLLKRRNVGLSVCLSVCDWIQPPGQSDSRSAL